jgi:hypothetical protein
MPGRHQPQGWQERTKRYSHTIHCLFDAGASEVFNASRYKIPGDLER